MQRLNGEPDLSFLGAVLYAEGGAPAALRLYASLAPSAPPEALESVRAQDAASWDWEGRARRSLEDGLYALVEQCLVDCSAQLKRIGPADVREAVQLGRLASQLTHAYERVRAARPKVADTGADYSRLSDEDMVALRGILDRANAPA